MLVRRGSKKRLRTRANDEIATKIDDHQTLARGVASIAQQQTIGAERRAIDQVAPLLTKDGILSTQPQQILVQAIHLMVQLTLAKVKLATLERGTSGWIGQ